MTQLLKHRDAISNYGDSVLAGIGKRGSSFMDLDAVSHDKDTGRLLFQEFKQRDERLHPAQRLVLADLARWPRCEVWFVRRLGEDAIGWARFGSGHSEVTIGVAEYQERFRRWWFGPVAEVRVHQGPARHEPAPPVAPLTAADIQWGGR